jgi:hypothetical protein
MAIEPGGNDIPPESFGTKVPPVFSKLPPLTNCCAHKRLEIDRPQRRAAMSKAKLTNALVLLP